MKVYAVSKYERLNDNAVKLITNYGGMEADDVKYAVMNYKPTETIGKKTIYTRKGSRFFYDVITIEISEDDEKLNGRQVIAGYEVNMWNGIVMTVCVEHFNSNGKEFGRWRHPRILNECGEWEVAAGTLTATEFADRVSKGTVK